MLRKVAESDKSKRMNRLYDIDMYNVYEPAVLRHTHTRTKGWGLSTVVMATGAPGTVPASNWKPIIYLSELEQRRLAASHQWFWRTIKMQRAAASAAAEHDLRKYRTTAHARPASLIILINRSAFPLPQSAVATVAICLSSPPRMLCYRRALCVCVRFYRASAGASIHSAILFHRFCPYVRQSVRDVVITHSHGSARVL